MALFAAFVYVVKAADTLRLQLAHNAMCQLTIWWRAQIVDSQVYADGASEFTKVNHVPFATAIQDVIFLPGNDRVLFALRDTNYLRVHAYPDIAVRCSARTPGRRFSTINCISFSRGTVAQQSFLFCNCIVISYSFGSISYES